MSQDHTLLARRILDDSVAALEQALCAVTGREHAVAVESIGSGLSLALRAAGVGAGDRVLCPALGHHSILDAVLSLSAIPLFVDVNPGSFLLDPFCLEYIIGRCLRAKEALPRALICSNLFGMPCNYTAIERICRQHGISLIEDASQSLGATLSHRNSGSFGRFSVVAVLEENNSAMGEDGAVLCDGEEDYNTLQRLRDGFGHQLPLPGMTVDFACITTEIVKGKLSTMARERGYRAQAASRYLQELESPVRMQQASDDASSACTQLVVALPDASSRAAAIEALNDSQIPCCIPFDSPLHRQISLRDSRAILVNSESICSRLLALPLHPWLTPSVIRRVCSTVNGACKQNSVELSPQEAAAV